MSPKVLHLDGRLVEVPLRGQRLHASGILRARLAPPLVADLGLRLMCTIGSEQVSRPDRFPPENGIDSNRSG